jgi:hypothetical protein
LHTEEVAQPQANSESPAGVRKVGLFALKHIVLTLFGRDVLFLQKICLSDAMEVKPLFYIELCIQQKSLRIR